MLVNQNSTKELLYSIEVGDTVNDGKGNHGEVTKVDIFKFRKFIQYIFRIKNDGKIEITKSILFTLPHI